MRQPFGTEAVPEGQNEGDRTWRLVGRATVKPDIPKIRSTAEGRNEFAAGRNICMENRHGPETSIKAARQTPGD